MDWLDVVRAAIPAAAFFGWTMAQKGPTAFDAVFPDMLEDRKYAIAAVGAVLVGAIASKVCADKADQKQPRSRRPQEQQRAPG